MKLSKYLLGGILLLMLNFCDNPGRSLKKQEALSGKIKKLSDIYVQRLLLYAPELGSFYRIDESDNSGLSENSLASFEKWENFEDSVYHELKNNTELPSIGTKAWYLYGILKEILEASIDLRTCHLELMRVDHIQGWQITLVDILKTQPVGTDKNREIALTRWKQLSQYVDNEIINLRKGIELGFTAPKEIVKLVLNQLDTLLEEPFEVSAVYDPARRDSSELFIQQWYELVENSIYPAIKKYRNFLNDEYYARARNSISISDLPPGEKCFEVYFRYQTSLKKTAQEITETAEYREKVNNLKLKMKGKTTFGTDSIPLIMNKINSDTAQFFKSKEELCGFIKKSINNAQKVCTNFFYKLPEGKVEVEVIPEKMENQMSSYFIPSINGSNNPSVYYVNLRNPEKRLRGNIETEVFHETFPGHHLQLGLSNEKKTNHLISRMIGVTGYLEGWASYAQILAEEMNLYSMPFSGLIVSLKSSQMLRLETGIHLQKWSRKQAVDFLLNTFTTSEETANQIINRAIVWPGQYSTYDTGLMEFIELREQAMLTLGDKFDIREFHSVMLEDGAIPLDMLREKVNWWLGQKELK